MTKEKMIKVTFIEFFEPYGIKAGASRDVAEHVAHKLLEVYGVIENPFVEKNPMITVEVVKSLVKYYGPGWYPTSKHDVRRDMIQKHLDDGTVRLLIDETIDDVHINWKEDIGEYEYKPGFHHIFSINGLALVLQYVPRDFHRETLMLKLGDREEVIDRIYREISSKI